MGEEPATQKDKVELLEVIRTLKTDLDDIKENHERLLNAREEQEEINRCLLRKLENEKINKKTQEKIKE